MILKYVTSTKKGNAIFSLDDENGFKFHFNQAQLDSAIKTISKEHNNFLKHSNKTKYSERSAPMQFMPFPFNLMPNLPQGCFNCNPNPPFSFRWSLPSTSSDSDKSSSPFDLSFIEKILSALESGDSTMRMKLPNDDDDSCLDMLSIRIIDPSDQVSQQSSNQFTIKIQPGSEMCQAGNPVSVSTGPGSSASGNAASASSASGNAASASSASGNTASASSASGDTASASSASGNTASASSASGDMVSVTTGPGSSVSASSASGNSRFRPNRSFHRRRNRSGKCSGCHRPLWKSGKSNGYYRDYCAGYCGKALDDKFYKVLDELQDLKSMTNTILDRLTELL